MTDIKEIRFEVKERVDEFCSNCGKKLVAYAVICPTAEAFRQKQCVSCGVNWIKSLEVK